MKREQDEAYQASLRQDRAKVSVVQISNFSSALQKLIMNLVWLPSNDLQKSVT